MPDGATAEEMERAYALELARQQEIIRAQEQARAAQAAAQAAAQTKQQEEEGKTELQKFAEGIPIIGNLIRSLPVLIWLLFHMKTLAVYLSFLVPLLWAGGAFFSVIGLRGFKLPLLPTQLPKSNVNELILASIILLIEVGIISLLIYLIMHPLQAGFLLLKGAL